jgi:hypothetical protein
MILHRFFKDIDERGILVRHVDIGRNTVALISGEPGFIKVVFKRVIMG